MSNCNIGEPKKGERAVQAAGASPDGALLLKGDEVAALLGISRALAYRWMAGGVLPVVRVPGARTLRVPREALMTWIQRNTRPSVVTGPGG